MESVKDFPRRKITTVVPVSEDHLEGEGVTLAVIVERLTVLRDKHGPEAYLQVLTDHDDDSISYSIVDFRDETDEEYQDRALRDFKWAARRAELAERARALSKAELSEPRLTKVPRTRSRRIKF